MGSSAWLTLAALAVAVAAWLLATSPQAAGVWLALERRRAGLRLRMAQIPGFTLPYLEGGRGEPLLLVHGFGADKDNFTRIAPFLTQRFRVIALDLPGFGAATRDPAARYDIASQVERLRCFIAELGLTRFHLGGNSMGGFIAAQYAATYPAHVQTLWLLDAAGCEGAYDTSVIQRYATEGQTALLVRTLDEFDALLATATERPLWLPPALRRSLALRAIRDQPLHERIFQEIGTQSPPLDRLCPAITAPTLIVWGRQDRILNPGVAAHMQALFPHSRCVLLEGIGHMPMVECPRRVAADYIAFVDSEGRAERRA
ncbi:MAG: alpha/beta hydrolase [Pseudomonadota bacterium]